MASATIDRQEIIDQLRDWQSELDGTDSVSLELMHTGSADPVALYVLQKESDRAELAGKLAGKMERDVRALRGVQTYFLVARTAVSKVTLGRMPFTLEEKISNPLGTGGRFDQSEPADARGEVAMSMRQRNDHHRMILAANMESLEGLRRDLDRSRQNESRLQLELERKDQRLADTFTSLQDSLDRKAQRELDVEKAKAEIERAQAEMESTRQKWRAFISGVMPILVVKLGGPDAVAMMRPLLAMLGEGEEGGGQPAAALPANGTQHGPQAAAAAPRPGGGDTSVEVFLMGLKREQRAKLLCELSVDQQAVFFNVERTPTRENVQRLVDAIKPDQYGALAQHLSGEQQALLMLVFNEAMETKQAAE